MPKKITKNLVKDDFPEMNAPNRTVYKLNVINNDTNVMQDSSIAKQTNDFSEIASSQKNGHESLESSTNHLPTYPLLFSEELCSLDKHDSDNSDLETDEIEDAEVTTTSDNTQVKEILKKKRGRKPKPKSDDDIKVIKKRGRKPKIVDTNADTNKDGIDKDVDSGIEGAHGTKLEICDPIKLDNTPPTNVDPIAIPVTTGNFPDGKPTMVIQQFDVDENKSDAILAPVKVLKTSTQSKQKTKYSLLPIKQKESVEQTPSKAGNSPHENICLDYNECSSTQNNKYACTFDRDTYIICLKISEDELNHIINDLNDNHFDQILNNSVKEPSGIAVGSKSYGNFSEMNSFKKNAEPNSTLPETTNIGTNHNHDIAYYMENFFNNMYSQTNIPTNYKFTMPKVFPETVNFDSINMKYDLNRSDSTHTLNDSSGIAKSGLIDSKSIKNLAKINLSSQISGKWINRRVDDILPAFKDEENWPQQSPYACWNCAEHFEGPPIGIPDHIEGQIDAMNMDNMKFYLYGNFCNFSCAARYLFDTIKDSTIWDKYSMLNVLHSRVHCLDKISKVTLAPERILLKKFGGYLTVEAYRLSHLGNREYQIFKPPMIPILYQMEESINDRSNSQIMESLNSDKKIIPMDTEKVERKLKLKRLKPLKGPVTLDTMMNVQMRSAVI